MVEAANAIGRFATVLQSKPYWMKCAKQLSCKKLIVIGESAARLPDEFHYLHKMIPWPEIIGFRNIAVHEYFVVDWEIVWSTATKDVPSLRKQIMELLSLYL